ncbi:probable leucine-rich repeat receptor-like protein kinase [Tanacetum coccineum]
MRMTTGESIALEIQFDLTVELLPSEEHKDDIQPSKKPKITIIPPKQLFIDLTNEDTINPSPKLHKSSPSAPNAPSKTPSTKDTSSSSIDYTPKSPTLLSSPFTNGYLNPLLSPPPRVPSPPPTQASNTMEITLSLSPITPLVESSQWIDRESGLHLDDAKLGSLIKEFEDIIVPFQDKGTSPSKQNSQSSSTTFIYKTLIIPSFLDSCFISSTVSEDKRAMLCLDFHICAQDKNFSSIISDVALRLHDNRSVVDWLGNHELCFPRDDVPNNYTGYGGREYSWQANPSVSHPKPDVYRVDTKGISDVALRLHDNRSVVDWDWSNIPHNIQGIYHVGVSLHENSGAVDWVVVDIHVIDHHTTNFDLKAPNEIKASLGWRVVYAWVGDDPCGNGDLPAWSGVTCSTQGDYRVLTELEVYAVSIIGPLPTAVTNLLDLTRLDLHRTNSTSNQAFEAS